MKLTKLWAAQGSKLAKMIVKRLQKSPSNTTELYSHTTLYLSKLRQGTKITSSTTELYSHAQPSTCSPELHQGPTSLIWVPIS